MNPARDLGYYCSLSNIVVSNIPSRPSIDNLDDWVGKDCVKSWMVGIHCRYGVHFDIFYIIANAKKHPGPLLGAVAGGFAYNVSLGAPKSKKK